MKKLFPIAFAVAVLAGCSKPSPLHQSMEDMGGAYNTMKDSNNIPAIKGQVALFKAGLNIAKDQPVRPEDQATFDEGIEELNILVVSIEAAVAANNLPVAKELMQKLGEARKKYHDKLGVKKK